MVSTSGNRGRLIRDPRRHREPGIVALIAIRKEAEAYRAVKRAAKLVLLLDLATLVAKLVFVKKRILVANTTFPRPIVR